MGRDDEWIHGEEWIHSDTAHFAGYGETAAVPGAAWTTVWGHEAGDEADEDEDDWPDDDALDDEWLDGEPLAAPGGPAGPGSGFGYRTGGWGHGGVPGFSAWMAVAVAVVAAVAGVAVGFLLTRGAPVASAADSPGSGRGGRPRPRVQRPTEPCRTNPGWARHG